MRETFKIARGAVGSPDAGAPHVYLRLTADNGMEGWGEARPSPKWSYETLETVTTTLRNYLIPAILGADPSDLSNPSDLTDLHRRMESEIAPGVTVGQPVAKSAIDMAAHDLVCHAKGQSLQSFFGGQKEIWPMGFIISAYSVQDAEVRAGNAAARGFTVLKVKVGLDPALDAK